MEPKPLLSLIIDDQEVQTPDGSTILEAARGAGMRIPTLCHHPDLTPHGGCRLCVVEVDGSPRLVASCVTPVRKGMQVVTINDRILAARRTVLEFLFTERNHYCMICARSGDCELQSLAYELQMDHLTVPTLEQQFPVDVSHETLVFDHNRCVLCGRCVRACREIAGTGVLDFHNRGGRVMVGADLSRPWGTSNCASCGVCLQVCPTGTIFHRHKTHVAVKGKSRDWKTIESTCPRCGLLCSTVNYIRGNTLLKIEGRLGGPGLDRGQLCRRGRFEPIEMVDSRLTVPHLRQEDGAWRPVGWDEALDAAALGLARARNGDGRQALGLISSGWAQEELVAMKDLMTKVFPAGHLDTLDGQHSRNLARAAAAAPEWSESPWAAIPAADTILMIGDDQCLAPAFRSVVRRAVLENQTKLVVVGAGHPLSAWARLSLPIESRQWPALLTALLPEDPDQAGLDFRKEWWPRGLSDLPSLLRSARRPLLVVGPELTGVPGGHGARQAAHLAATLPRWFEGRRPLIVLKPAGNSAMAWSLGLPAAQAMNGGRYQAGLVVLAGPGEWPRAGLPDLEFLVVISPYRLQAWPPAARVLLPAPTWLESGGTYASADGGRTARAPRVLGPPTGVRPGVRILSGLTRRLAAGPAQG